jgi:glyoxylase-like metal-dependent hydrolase (beta-lactamase superfamily II)
MSPAGEGAGVGLAPYQLNATIPSFFNLTASCYIIDTENKLLYTGNTSMKLTDNLYFYSERGILHCNTYVIKGSPGIIIDPGSLSFLDSMVEDMRGDGIEPEEIGIILNTHLHGDHCGANKGFKRLSGARVALHPAQKQFYGITVVDTARLFGLPAVHVEEDDIIEDGRLDIGATSLELVHAPGHSPNSICFYSGEEKTLICGDVVFAGNVGRVDLPGGDAAQLAQSIENLSPLDIELLLPGHMGTVSEAARVQSNFEFIRDGILKWL